ncbi:MAG: S8 family serine peptidase [Myxococcaceae bacterium]|nr:S8 family serine peptidase [Myxococcaceae bacterium]
MIHSDEAARTNGATRTDRADCTAGISSSDEAAREVTCGDEAVRVDGIRRGDAAPPSAGSLCDDADIRDATGAANNDDVTRGAALIRRVGGRVVRGIARRHIVAELSRAQAQALAEDPSVRRIEPDPPRFPLATPLGSGQVMPWGIAAIGAPGAWSQSPPLRRGAKVCVIDSGLYAAHDDLAPGGGPLAGYPADIWNQDECGHGTHVAGTIAALDNDTGVVGVDPLGADLFAVRVFGGQDCGWTFGSDLADAIDQCVSAGAKVINLSLGGFSPSTLEREAIERAWRSGAILVAAAGNEGDSELEYPASYPAVLSVGAIDEEGRVTAFSQRNPQVDLVAPGTAVLSTVPFVSRHLVEVDGLTFAGAPLENARESDGVEGPLVDGGRCTTPGAWAGAIVVCQRGDNTFAEKVDFAQRAGAVGAVIFNDDRGGFSGTLGDMHASIPAIALSGEDGAELLAHLGSGATLVNGAQKTGSGYAPYSGTSMAAPHVAGAAALLFAQVPSSTNAAVRAALLATAQDVGEPGVDPESGHGLVRVDRALAALRAGMEADGPPMTGFLVHCEGLRCTFADASVPLEGDIVARHFDFGDGSSADGAQATSHDFPRGGTFTVTLTVTDSSGRTGQSTVPISVISADARPGAIAADGSREIALDWAGIKTTSVQVIRDGRLVGIALNTGSVVDRLEDGARPATYRVCSAGGESCSGPLTVLPPCG